MVTEGKSWAQTHHVDTRLYYWAESRLFRLTASMSEEVSFWPHFSSPCKSYCKELPHASEVHPASFISHVFLNVARVAAELSHVMFIVSTT